MPGTPDPVLGSRTFTLLVAVATSLALGALAVRSRERLQSFPVAFAASVGYGLGCVAAWAGVRYVADAFVAGMVADPLTAMGFVAAGVAVLALQAAVALTLYARWRLVAPLVTLVLATTLVLYLFLQVRGESDPLGLFTILFGPVILAGIGTVGAAEAGVRRLVARADA